MVDSLQNERPLQKRHFESVTGEEWCLDKRVQAEPKRAKVENAFSKNNRVMNLNFCKSQSKKVQKWRMRSLREQYPC